MAKKRIPTGYELIKNLPKIEQRVEWILINYPATKGNDTLLQFYYVKHFAPFIKISMKHFEQLFLINFESIRRSRQKIQAKKPELKPTKRTQIKRKVREEACRDYYGGNIIPLNDYNEEVIA